MTQQIKIKRDELKAISAPLRNLVKQGTIHSINEGLIKIYAESGHTVLKTYNMWKSEGFQVDKGSKALLLWGEPKAIKKGDEPKTEEEKEDSFFPIAFVFSNLQVKPSAHLSK